MGSYQSSNKNIPNINIYKLYNNEYINNIFEQLTQLGCDDKVYY